MYICNTPDIWQNMQYFDNFKCPLLKNQTVELIILYIYRVENIVANQYYNFRQKICFELRKNDCFLFIPIVMYLYFEIAPKKNQMVDFLETLQIN